jgi:hypothetical protein
VSRELLPQLDEVDCCWQLGRPLSPWQLNRKYAGRLNREDLAELLAADSEWRWRFAKVQDTASDELWSDCADCRDIRPRTVESYLRAFPELAQSSKAKLRFVEAEFMARSRWGIPPKITDFAKKFPDIEGIDSHLRNCLEDLSFLYVSAQKIVDNPSDFSVKSRKSVWTEPATVTVRTPLSIGRQRTNEPKGVFLLPGRQRIIVGANGQRNVSREHCLVIRESFDCCIVQNISPMGDLTVNGTLFQSGWQQLLLLPLTIELSDHRLVFFQR